MTTLVLVPGLDGTGDLFGPFVDALGDAFETSIVRFGEAPHSLERHAGYVQDAIGAASGPVVVVAESFGGPVAIEALSRDSVGVEALVLVASFVDPPLPGLRWSRHLLRLVYASRYLDWFREVGQAVFMARSGADRQMMAEVRRANRRSRRAVLVHRVGLLATVDVAEKLRGLSCSVTYLAGRQDRLVPVHRQARKIQQLRPDATVRFVDGPHLLLQFRAEACADALRDLGVVQAPRLASR